MSRGCSFAPNLSLSNPFHKNLVLTWSCNKQSCCSCSNNKRQELKRSTWKPEAVLLQEIAHPNLQPFLRKIDRKRNMNSNDPFHLLTSCSAPSFFPDEGNSSTSLDIDPQLAISSCLSSSSAASWIGCEPCEAASSSDFRLRPDYSLEKAKAVVA